MDRRDQGGPTAHRQLHRGPRWAGQLGRQPSDAADLWVGIRCHFGLRWEQRFLKGEHRVYARDKIGIFIPSFMRSYPRGRRAAATHSAHNPTKYGAGSAVGAAPQAPPPQHYKRHPLFVGLCATRYGTGYGFMCVYALWCRVGSLFLQRNSTPDPGAHLGNHFCTR